MAGPVGTCYSRSSARGRGSGQFHRRHAGILAGPRGARSDPGGAGVRRATKRPAPNWSTSTSAWSSSWPITCWATATRRSTSRRTSSCRCSAPSRQFRGQSQLRTWIYRIVVNQARNRQRWWRRRHRVEPGVARPAHLDSTATRWANAQTAPDRLFAQKELGRRLWAALERLPFDQRTAVVLREIDGLELRGDRVFARRHARHGQVAPDARASGAADGAAGGDAMIRWTVARRAVCSRRTTTASCRWKRRVAIQSHLRQCPGCSTERHRLRRGGRRCCGRPSAITQPVDPDALGRHVRVRLAIGRRAFADDAHPRAVRRHAPGVAGARRRRRDAGLRRRRRSA